MTYFWILAPPLPTMKPWANHFISWSLSLPSVKWDTKAYVTLTDLHMGWPLSWALPGFFLLGSAGPGGILGTQRGPPSPARAPWLHPQPPKIPELNKLLCTPHTCSQDFKIRGREGEKGELRSLAGETSVAMA